MRILVTGASGFVGSWLCHRLKEQGAHVIGAVRRRPLPDSLFCELGLPDRIDVVDAPLTDAGAAAALIDKAGPDVIYNLIGQSQIALSLSEPARTVESNTFSGWALCEAVRLSGRHIPFVHASTDALYPALPAGEKATETTPVHCSNVYEASKAALDLLLLSYARTFGMPIAIARLGNIYGPGDAHRARIIPSLLHAIATGEPPVLRGGGRAVRCLLFVDDAIQGLQLIAAEAPGRARGEIINLSGPQPMTILEISRVVLAAAGAHHLAPRIEDDSGPVSIKVSSSEKAQQLLGWSASTPFAEGVAAAIAWERGRASLLQEMSADG